MNAITFIPTRINLEQAWEQYTALVLAADRDRALWLDLEHCKAIARAFDRWQTLFLASEKAA